MDRFKWKFFIQPFLAVLAGILSVFSSTAMYPEQADSQKLPFTTHVPHCKSHCHCGVTIKFICFLCSPVTPNYFIFLLIIVKYR